MTIEKKRTEKVRNYKGDPQTKILDNKEYRIPEGETWVLHDPAIAFGPIHLDMNKHYTYADYLTWMDEIRRELIEGFVYVMSAPNEFHARITARWTFLTTFFVKKKKGNCRIYHAPFDVRLPIHGEKKNDEIENVVQPDICVICDLSKIGSVN